MTARFHLLCSASTPSIRARAFPDDEPLDPRGREDLRHVARTLPASAEVLRSPALCAAQTAEGLSFAAQPEPALRECDFGRWTGRKLTDVLAQEPDALAAWLRDPRSAPHGGESLVKVVARVGIWMDSLLTSDQTILAITHASVIQAAIAHALGGEPRSLLGVDIGPLGHAKLSNSGGRWRLGALIPLKEARRIGVGADVEVEA